VGKFTGSYENVITGKNKVVNKMIIAYLKLWNSRIYARLQLQRDSYFNQLRSFIDIEELESDTPDDIKKISDARSAVQKTLDTTEEKLQELELQFLQGDYSDKMLYELYQELELESLGLTPEEIAVKIRDGKDPLAGFTPFKL